MGVKKYFLTREVEIKEDDTSNEIKYYLNDTEITKEEGESIDSSQFKERIKKELNKFIYPFDNIVVLAGAGASIVLKEDKKPDEMYGHTISMLSDVINKEIVSAENMFSIEEMCAKCMYPIAIEKEGAYNPEFNLEDFLSKVIIFEEFYTGDDKAKYTNTKNKILKIIREKTSYSFDRNKHNHGALIKVFSDLHKSPNRLTVVTTNYDTLFEEAASHLGFTVFDGFSFDSNNIFDIDLFDWSLVKSIINVKSEKLEYKKSCLNLMKIHGSLTWTLVDENVKRVEKNSSYEPIMIFPSSNKYTHSYEKPYFELFSKFQEQLKRNNTLLITTGFSFADNHIAKMITQAIKTSPSLSLLATDHSLDSNNKNKNWEELIRLKDDGYRIAFLRSTLSSDLVSYFSGEDNGN